MLDVLKLRWTARMLLPDPFSCYFGAHDALIISRFPYPSRTLLDALDWLQSLCWLGVLFSP